MGLSIWTRLGKLINLSKQREWEKIEYFDESWKLRIEMMSKYINENDSVIDVGCGPTWLREYLNSSNKYIGIDYKKRSENIVFDFNSKANPPELKSDIVFCSGVLEYIESTDRFVKWISDTSNKCIVSYCTIENFPDLNMRKQNAWKNNFSESELIKIFNKYGFNIKDKTITVSRNSIFIFIK